MIGLRRTLLKLFRRRRLYADLETELAYHRELAREHGNSIGLGNTTVIKESALDLWRFSLLENAGRDLLFAIRGLRRNPAFTVTAVMSLALGIGVGTAIRRTRERLPTFALAIRRKRREPTQCIRVTTALHSGFAVCLCVYGNLAGRNWSLWRHNLPRAHPCS
jgi:hypothetical protein